jgi:hypothetical protein
MKAGYVKYKKKAGEEKPRKNRDGKTVIIILAAAALFAAVYIAVTMAIAAPRGGGGEETRKISFHPADYTRDITADAAYMELDRQFYYSDPSYGLTVAVVDEEADEVPATYRATYRCIASYLRLAMAGDTEAMKALLSEKYEKDGGRELRRVSPQKLYDIVITVSSSDTLTESGEVRDRFPYEAEHKIGQNDGAFRDDMGSDCSKKEFFTVTMRDGKAEIDAISVYRTVS